MDQDNWPHSFTCSRSGHEMGHVHVHPQDGTLTPNFHWPPIAPLLARKLAAMLTHSPPIAPLLARKLAAMLTHSPPIAPLLARKFAAMLTHSPPIAPLLARKLA